MKYLMISLLVLLNGCAFNSNQYKVIYDSTPQGASLVCAGVNMGTTPVTTYYNKPSLMVKNGGTDCVMTWVSGARTYVRSISMDLVSQYPDGLTLTMPRPPNYPNIEVDLQAAHYKSMRQQAPVQQEYQYKPPTNTYCNRVMGQVMCTTY